MSGFLAGFICIIINVSVHFWILKGISGWLNPKDRRHRHSLLIMFCLTLLHCSEIAVFALAFMVLSHFELGSFTESPAENFLDYFYHSASNYTTLGLAQTGFADGFRVMAVLEALNGFMMLTWSASFLFRGVGQFWED